MEPTNFDITKEGVLVDLSIGARGISARSKRLSKEAADKHDADPRSVSGSIQKLLPRDLKGVTKALNGARESFRSNTLPWADGSWRLCPLGRYDQLHTELEIWKNVLGEAVSELDSHYERMAADYKRRVNDLSDETPFPSRDELLSSFGIGLSEMPIADPSSIYLNHLSETQVGEFKSNFKEEISERLAAANEDLAWRLIEQVSKIKNQVGKDPKDTKFHKSLIENLKGTIQVVGSLNLTNDPKIDKLIKRIEKDLSKIDVEDLKVDAQLRSKVEDTTSEILKDLQRYKG